MKNKKAFEMPFSWLFAIIAGAAILLLAIYGASKFIKTSSYAQESEAAKSLASVLNPITNGITSGYKPEEIKLNEETKIILSCEESTSKSPYFGAQKMAFSKKSSLFGKWTETGANISIPNKYLFSQKLEQGKKIYLFSKPFYAGFRVDDLIMISMTDYCFVAAPNEVQEEIGDLGIKNINITTSIAGCKKGSSVVCFGFSDNECNMSVYGTCQGVDCESEFELGYTEKKGKRMDFFGSLIYASIFSDYQEYKCNVARLGKKIAELSEIYSGKAGIISSKGCDSLVDEALVDLNALTKNLTIAKIESLYDKAKIIDGLNCRQTECRLYSSAKC